MANILMRAWTGYNALLINRPIAAPAISTGVLMGCGDMMAQSIEGRNLRQMNWRRTGRLFALGCCLYGPWLNQWYKFLAARLQDRPLGWVKMVAADQLLMAPCVIGSFLTVVPFLNTGDTAAVAANLKKFPQVLTTNYQVWPAVQTVNFLFVPVHLRIMLANCVALVWNTYISWIAHLPAQ